jgi:hypothetical protein
MESTLNELGSAKRFCQLHTVTSGAFMHREREQGANFDNALSMQYLIVHFQITSNSANFQRFKVESF